MTEQQIFALNSMATSNTFDGCVSDDFGPVRVVLVDGDIRRTWFHWKLIYSTYDVDLYSDGVISSYDASVLRYMYNEYMWFDDTHQRYHDDTTLDSI